MFVSTGHYYYRARYYDPKLGRFISEDPIGFRGGVNFLGYVRNAPINYIDPLGMADCKPLYCDSDVLKAIESAYIKALTLNGAFKAGVTQYETGFSASPDGAGGFTAGPIKSGGPNARMRVPMPSGPRGVGATFHTHFSGNGMPSTPLDNVTGAKDKGDSLAAVNSGFDVFVISGQGLAVAPWNSPDPIHGAGSYYIIEGKNFNDWYKKLKQLCKSLAQ